MDNTLIIGDSHTDSLALISKYYKNIKMIAVHGCTIYGLYKRVDDIFKKIDTFNKIKFKNVIFVLGYVDINGALLYFKYDSHNNKWIYDTLDKSLSNFYKFLLIFKKKYKNINIFACNHVYNAYSENKTILNSKLHAEIMLEEGSNVVVNNIVVNQIIKKRKKYILYFEKKYKKFCDENNIIFIDLNKYLKKIVDKKCICLLADIKTRTFLENDHHYIYEIFLLCFFKILIKKKYFKINKTFLYHLFNDYKLYIQYIKHSKKMKFKKNVCNNTIII